MCPAWMRLVSFVSLLWPTKPLMSLMSLWWTTRPFNSVSSLWPMRPLNKPLGSLWKDHTKTDWASLQYIVLGGHALAEIWNFTSIILLTNDLHCLKLLVSFCRPFGIATSWSTHYQQTIGVAKICMSNSVDVVWIQQSTERWNHVEWKQCILLALIFYCGRSPRVEWKHGFQLAMICYCSRSPQVEWKHCFQLALFYRGMSPRVEWTTHSGFVS